MTVPDAAAESAAAGGDAPNTPSAAAAMRCPRCGRDYEAGLQFCPRDGAALGAAAPAAGLAGQVLGEKYLVERSLGRGAMGEVYLARHVRLAKPYAVKVMSRALLDDPDALRRFHFEAESASRLAHPHVATVYDVGDAPDGRVYFVMDYVPGESLAALVAREGALAPARAAAVAAQIADGLGAAHELRLVHRDLKPDNVLVERRAGGADHATVVDFGVAKAVDGDGPGRTRTGLVVGTPEFMSPEQAAGGPLDARSDIYALGLVAFYMLTGASAFPADTGRDAMLRRLTAPPRTLAQARPEVAWPASVESVMARVLARDPEERYQSAAAFGRDLLRAVAEWQRTPARRPLARTTDALRQAGRAAAGVPARLGRTLRGGARAPRSAAPVVAGAAAALLLLAGVRAWRTDAPPGAAGGSAAPAAGASSGTSAGPAPGASLGAPAGTAPPRPPADERAGASSPASPYPAAPPASASPPPASPRYTLTVAVGAGAGDGRVRDGRALDCAAAPGGCAAAYDSGAAVTLRALPARGSAFGGWGGACAGRGAVATCVVRMGEARAVTARFARAAAPAGAVGAGAPGGVRAPSTAARRAEWLAWMRAAADPARGGRDPRAALAGVARALPWLGTGADSAEARYYEARAHLQLGDSARACAALRGAGARAYGDRRGAATAAAAAARWAAACVRQRPANPY